jgi:hypothetical protein
MFARAQLLMHSEIKSFVPDAYRGGLTLDRDYDPSSRPSNESRKEHELKHRLRNRTEQVYGAYQGLQEYVSVLGADKENIAEVRDIPVEEWMDKTSCMLCPACHELNPLGTVLCFNMNCGAQYRYAQHRFNCVPERFEIRKTDKVRVRTEGNNNGDNSASAASSDGTSAMSEEVESVAERVSRRVVTYVQKTETYGGSMKISFAKQFLRNARATVMHITKFPEYQQWDPFGFFSRNSPCWINPARTVHPEDEARTPYDKNIHTCQCMYSTREVKERARSGEMVFAPGRIDLAYCEPPHVPDIEDDSYPLQYVDPRCDYDHFISNIAMEGEQRMSYHKFRFAKHTLIRVAWKLLAMFPQIEYYLGGSRAEHLKQQGEWCNRVFRNCLAEVCWHEFGSKTAFDPEELWRIRKMFNLYEKGKYGCSMSERYNAPNHPLYELHYQDNKVKGYTALPWYCRPYPCHSDRIPRVYFTLTSYTVLNHEVMPEMASIAEGRDEETPRAGFSGTSSILRKMTRHLANIRVEHNGRFYCNRFCGTDGYYRGPEAVHPMVDGSPSCNCKGVCGPGFCQCIVCFQVTASHGSHV